MTPEQIKSLAERMAKRWDHIADCDEVRAAEILRQYADQMASAEPLAWRVECRWADRSKGGDWQLYSTYNNAMSAESSRQAFGNPGDIEARIVPLYARAALAQYGIVDRQEDAA